MFGISVRKKWLFDEPQFNLAPVTDLKVGNPWPDTKLKDYVHHLKGKKRKDAGSNVTYESR
jgi:hypothetical protein